MEENLQSLREELEELLKQKQYASLRARMKEMNTADIADVLDDMEDEDSLKMFRILPKDMAADVFADLELDDQQYIITSLSDKEASSIIDNLYADDATDLLEEMPANVVKKILANAHPDTRKDINHLLRYPDDSAGSFRQRRPFRTAFCQVEFLPHSIQENLYRHPYARQSVCW